MKFLKNKRVFILLCLLLKISCIDAQNLKFNYNGNKKSSFDAIEVIQNSQAENPKIQFFSNGKLKKEVLYTPASKGIQLTFRGLETLEADIDNSKEIIAISKDVVYQFIKNRKDLISKINVYGNDSQVVEEMYNILSSKIGFFFDEEISGEFHGKNVGNIVFFDEKTRDVTSSIELGKDNFFFRAYTDSSFANKVLRECKRIINTKEYKKRKSNQTYFEILELGFNALSNKETTDTDNSSQGFILGKERHKYYELKYALYFDGNFIDYIYTKEYQENPDFLQSMTFWEEKNLLDRSFFDKLDNRKLLTIGLHTLRIEAFLTYKGKIVKLDSEDTPFTDRVAVGKIQVNVASDIMHSLKLSDNEKYTKAFANYMKDELGNAKFIKDVTKKFNFKYNKDGKYEIKKVVTPYDNFEYVKNDFGQTLRKQTATFVYVKEKATNYCYAFYLVYGYEFDGSGYANSGEFWHTYTRELTDGVRVSTDTLILIDCNIIK